MRQAVLSLLLACEPEEWFFASGGYVRFLHSRSFEKTFAKALALLFVCAVPGWRRAVPERQCHWRFPGCINGANGAERR